MQQCKVNIVAYTFIFILQLLMLPCFEFLSGTPFMLMVLLLFLGTAASFAWTSRAYQHQINNLTAFVRSMVPYCIRLTGIAASDALLFCFIRKSVNFAITWLVFSLTTLFLSGAVIFAVGAARTMLFKDR